MQKILVAVYQSTVPIMSAINTTQQSIIHSFGSFRFGYICLSSSNACNFRTANFYLLSQHKEMPRTYNNASTVSTRLLSQCRESTITATNSILIEVIWRPSVWLSAIQFLCLQLHFIQLRSFLLVKIGNHSFAFPVFLHILFFTKPGFCVYFQELTFNNFPTLFFPDNS